jgi:ABC-type bacteriocin/lantibiotic exporter with double-glycine peptidase domain
LNAGARAVLFIGLLSLYLTPGARRAEAQGPATPGPASVRLTVPYFPDATHQCGPSALASVLRFWGADAEPAALSLEVYRPALRGSLNVDLLLAAESHGMTAEIMDGGLAGLKRALGAGHPVIAYLDTGFRVYPVGHYAVVTGYDDVRGGLFAHSGGEKDRFMPYARFMKQWEKTELWALLITPHR